jgi:hypothetical protein|tara:strand:- start:205 stop:528 length:324 start_codon:yes stop_codon:yes gene_type:complete
MSEKITDFINKLNTGDNAGAGEAFKDALRDKVATSLDAQRQDIAGRIFSGVEPEAHSDPKPAVTDPSDKTDQIMDTTGQEIEFTDNGNEQPTPEAEVPSAESQPVNQ